MRNAHLTLRKWLLALLLPALAIASTTSLARADGHDGWELLVGSYPGPLQGACGARLDARAVGLPPSTLAVIGRLDGPDFVELARLETYEAGSAFFDLSSPYPPDCAPGDVLTLAVRVVVGGGFLGDEDGPFEATIEREMRPPSPGVLSITAEVPGSCAALRITGNGFPALADVRLFEGDATPFAHDFAPIASVTADDRGSFSISSEHLAFRPCEDGAQFGIYAWVGSFGGGNTDFPRASAIFTVGPPTPSSAGNAGLAAQRTSRGVPILFAVASLLLLSAARTLTAARAPRP
jgi:hypothetical protein